MQEVRKQLNLEGEKEKRMKETESRFSPFVDC